MPASMLETLARIEGAPAVSILCPLDPRRPGNDEDRLRFVAARAEAANALAARNGAAQAVLANVDAAFATIDLEHPPAAVAVFATADMTHVMSLGVPVPMRVVVDREFALSDVAAAAARTASVRVVVLSQGVTRCFDLDDGVLTERHGAFPVKVTPPTEADTPHRDFPLDEHERDEAARFVFRAVAHALDALHHSDPRPLMLIGPARDIAYFDAVDHVVGGEVVARIHGNYAHASTAEIQRLVDPALVTYLDAAAARTVTEVREAMGHNALHGVDAVRAAAHDGRGRALYVEERLPAADELVGAVLRHGGTVDVLPEGALHEYGGCALLLRW